MVREEASKSRSEEESSPDPSEERSNESSSVSLEMEEHAFIAWDKSSAFLDAINQVRDGIHKVTQNKSSSDRERYLYSFINIALGQIPRVKATTYTRQALSWAMAIAAINHSDLRWMMGSVAAYPILLNIFGLAQDRRVGRQVDQIVEDFCRNLNQRIIAELEEDGFEITKTLPSLDSPIIQNEETEINKPQIPESELLKFCNQLMHEIFHDLEEHNGIHNAIEEKCSRMLSTIAEKSSQQLTSNTNLEDIVEEIVDGDAKSLSSEEITSESEEDSAPGFTRNRSNVEEMFKAWQGKFSTEIPRETREQLEQDLKEMVKELKENLKHKYWDTKFTNICRFMNIALNSTLTIVAGYCGILPDLAPTLCAFGIYCVLRDLVQLYVVLPDNIPKYYFLATLGSAFCYSLNQTLVSFLMSRFAGQSGQAGADLPYSDVAVDDFLRGLFNWAGETMDLATLVFLHAYMHKVTPEVKLELASPTSEKVVREMFGVHTGRVSLFFQLVLATALFFYFVPISSDHTQDEQLGIKSAADGAYLGLFYTFLVALAARVNWPYSSTVQTEEAFGR